MAKYEESELERYRKMAVPKKRTGHSAQGKRRSNWKATKPAITKCPNCGATVLAHTVCTACGTYKGKPVSLKDQKAAQAEEVKEVKETKEAKEIKKPRKTTKKAETKAKGTKAEKAEKVEEVKAEEAPAETEEKAE